MLRDSDDAPLEIVNPSMVAGENELIIAGAGSVQFQTGRPPYVSVPMHVVRLRGGTARAVRPPYPGGRYLFARLIGVPGDPRLVWGEPDSVPQFDAQPNGRFSPYPRPVSVWAATFRNSRWSGGRRLAVAAGLSWMETTPTVVGTAVATALPLGYAAVGGGRIDLLLSRRGSGWRRRTFDVGGIPVYTSATTSADAVFLGFITNETDSIARTRNTVFVMDSARTAAAWSRARPVTRASDGAATMLSLLPTEGKAVHAVWGENRSGGLQAEVIRRTRVDLSGANGREDGDLLSPGAPFTGLHAVSDRRGRIHVVYQVSRDDRPATYYAVWASPVGWGAPQRLGGDLPTRDASIAVSPKGEVIVTHSQLVGMSGPIPRFATLVTRPDPHPDCLVRRKSSGIRQLRPNW